jgi:hypothetical protein
MPTSFKIILIGLLLIVVGLFWGIRDLRLKMSGRSTTATITGAAAASRGSVKVFYVFSDETGADCNGECVKGSDWVPPAEGKLPVIYLPGQPSTVRPADAVGYTGFLVFLLGIAVTAGGFWYFNRESVVEAHAQTMRDIEDARDPTKNIKRALRLPRNL